MRLLIAATLLLTACSTAWGETDLSNLTNEEVCRGSFVKNDDLRSYLEEVRKRDIFHYCENQRCLSSIPDLVEYLNWYQKELEANLGKPNTLSLRWRFVEPAGSIFNHPLKRFLDYCEDSTQQFRN